MFTVGFIALVLLMAAAMVSFYSAGLSSALEERWMWNCEQFVLVYISLGYFDIVSCCVQLVRPGRGSFS